MPLINKEKIIGWYNKSTDRFLCNECFFKEENIEKKDYKPVLEYEIREENMYICDECGERFEEVLNGS